MALSSMTKTRKALEEYDRNCKSQNIFDKKIVLDNQAAERLANASVVSCCFRGEKEPVIRNAEEMQKWVSSLTKEKT